MADDGSSGEHGRFYAIDSTRVSIREYWWGTRNPTILIALLLKFLRIRIPGATDDPIVASLAAFEVEESSVPEAVRQRFAPLLRHLVHLGFEDVIWHVLADDLQHAQTYLATVRHRS